MSNAFGPIETATVNDTQLAYLEEGEGEAVVFVHGGLSDLRVWENQLPVVGRVYRAISYSRRFARPNDDIDPAADDQMGQHVDDLAAFLGEIGAGPAHLVGNSWGAFISLLAAIRYPELVRTLVLEEPPVITLFVKNTPPSPADVLRLFLTRPRTALTLFRVVGTMLIPVQRAFARGEDEEALRIFCQGVGGKEQWDGMPEARLAQMRENLSALRAQMLGAGFPPLSDDEVRGVKAPVLLVTGELSPSIAIRLTDRLEELLPRVERIEIPAASHAMHEENPPAVNEAILDFIGRERDASI